MGTLNVTHPESGEVTQIKVSDDHDGSRVKVEFPDGTTTYTEGFDPTKRALSGEQFTVPCGDCGSRQVLSGGNGFICSACGAKNMIEVRTSTDAGEAATSQGQ